MGSLLRWALGRLGYVSQEDYDYLKGRYDHLATIRDDRLRLFREWDKEQLELKATIARHEQSLRDEKIYREKLQSELESVEYRNQQLLAERKQLAELLESSERSKSNHLGHFNNVVDENRRLEESVATQQRLLAEMDAERQRLAARCDEWERMLQGAVAVMHQFRLVADGQLTAMQPIISRARSIPGVKENLKYVGNPENPGREATCGGGGVVDGGITDGSSVRGGGGSLPDGNDSDPVV